MKRGAPVTPRKLAVAIIFACAVPVASACTLLVKFDEPDTDGTEGGADEPPPRADVIQPSIDSGPTPDTGPPADPLCAGRSDGFNYDTADPLARCCGGKQAKVDSNDNCGVCGLRCVDNQQCTLRSGYYYCRGCAFDGNALNSRCASSTSCCSKQFDSTGLCAASTCSTGGASCNNEICTARNAVCEVPGNSSFACVYR